jgi:hypothetical protein
MIWFLERGQELLVCEARQAADGNTFELSTIEPLGEERVERFTDPTQMVERFVEVQQMLRQTGWIVVPERASLV